MELTSEEIEANHEYINDVAEANGKTFDDVVEILNDQIKNQMENRQSGNRPRGVIIERAKGALDDLFANKEHVGTPFVIIPICELGKIKDWNADQMAIVKKLRKDGKIDEMMEKGHVFTLEKDGRKFPLAKILTSTTKLVKILNGKEVAADEMDPKAVESKILIPIDGEEWKYGDVTEPVYRDNRLISNGRPNQYGYGQALSKRLNLQVIAWGWPVQHPDDARLCYFSLKKGQADPESKDFFFKEYLAFTPYIFAFDVEEKKCQPWKYVLDAGSVEGKASDFDMVNFDVTLKESLKKMHDAYGEVASNLKNETGKATPDFIPLIYDVKHLEDGHNAAVITDDDGNVMRTAGGYDKMAWNKLILASATVSLSAPKGKTPFYILGQASLGITANAFISPYIFQQPKLPAKCLVALDSYRGSKHYDRETKTTSIEPGNGDIVFTVKGLANIKIGVEKVQVPEEV